MLREDITRSGNASVSVPYCFETQAARRMSRETIVNHSTVSPNAAVREPDVAKEIGIRTSQE